MTPLLELSSSTQSVPADCAAMRTSFAGLWGLEDLRVGCERGGREQESSGCCKICTLLLNIALKLH